MAVNDRHGGKSGKLRALIFTHEHEAERANRKWDKGINSENPPPMIHFLLKTA